ncbi:MAG: RHS repeat-associated core domain-containing protein, partial [Bergeyella sp.]
DYQNNLYIYQYKDHLGNVRVSYTKNSGGGAEVLDKNDYYPFGMNHLNTGGTSYFGQGSYTNYKYNGKELQETGLYDYGWRQYIPDIARWNGIDQLAESYNSYSPYAYVMNNPVSSYDPDGRLVANPTEPVEINGMSWGSGGIMSYLMAGGRMSGMDYSQWIGGFSYAAGGGGESLTASSTGSMAGLQNYFMANGATHNSINYLFDNYSNGYVEWWTDMPKIGIAGDIQGLTIHRAYLRSDDSNSSVGQPGEWESLIPIWGSGRAAVDHFQNGNYWRSAAYTALAVSDVFMVKSIATGLGRGAWKLLEVTPIPKSVEGAVKLYSNATFKSFEKQLETNGIESILKSQSKIQLRLAEHLQKLEQIKASGGFSSSVEREIRTFNSQLEAIKDLLKR